MSETTATTAAPTTTVAAATETSTSSGAQYGILIIIFFVILLIVIIYCLVKSLMCFGKSGSTAEKAIGVLIAFFTGPFYLLYLNFNKGYCEDETEMPAPMPAPMYSSQQMGGRRRK